MSTSMGGKVVAITGGARGIGLATVKAFVAEGARVAIGDIDAGLAERAAAGLGSNVVCLALDVTSEASFAAFLTDAVAALGPLDVLVNNAGVMLTGEFLAETAKTEAMMIDINLRGVITGCKLAGAMFAQRGGGHIVNIASMAGIAGFPGVATYCATKFGVVGLSHALREELRPRGVKVSAVLPGIVHTDLSAGVKMPGVAESFVSVEPEDIASAVVSVVAGNPALAYVPGRLGVVLRAALAMPEGPRRLLTKIARVDKAYLNVDQATRDAYHARATEVAE